MKAKQQDRRRFLKDSAALAGLAVVGAGSIRSASGQAPANGQTAASSAKYHLDVPSSRNCPIEKVMGIITPHHMHHIQSHGSHPPVIDPAEYRLVIHGLVHRPLIFTLEELKRLPSVSRVHFVMCAGNQGRTLETRMSASHGASSCDEWTGVLLSVLLREAGLKPEAKWVVSEGSEARKATSSIPLEKAMDDVIVAYGQNGDSLQLGNGYPVKLIAPGFEGIRNIKWLKRIYVVDRPYMSKWETKVYSNLHPDGKTRWFYMELAPRSVITFPFLDQRLPGRGFYEIRGLAFSGGGAITRVEVSTDGGRTWKDAQPQEPVHRKAWTRFRLGWTWNGEETVLMSRCTDERGNMQPSLAQLSEIWGVNLDWWITTTNVVQDYNPIQPWRVARDGTVHNAMWDFLDINVYRERLQRLYKEAGGETVAPSDGVC